MIADSLPPGITRHLATDKAEWLKLRGKDVTASVVAAVLGAHPYCTMYELWHRKAGLLPDETVEPVIRENSISLPPMLRGSVLEPIVPSILQMLRPTWTISKADHYYRDYAHRIGATPDFFAVDPDKPGFGVVQVKTSDYFAFKNNWIDEHTKRVEPPLWILCQTVVEASLTGASWAAVAVMVNSNTLDLHLIDVPIHEQLMDRLRVEVPKFWVSIDDGTPPAPDFGRDADVFKTLWPSSDGTEIDLSYDNYLAERAAELDRLKATAGAIADQIDEIKSEFKFRLENHESAILADRWKVKYKTEPRQGYVVKPSAPRVLRFSRRK